MKRIQFLARFAVLAFSLFVFGGCAGRTVIQPQKVKVPQKCIVPKVDCKISHDANDTTTVLELIKCVKDHREAAKVCQ